MTRPVDDQFEQEYHNWKVAFENCDRGVCCPANTKYHRPRCPRRAAHVAVRRERWVPEMEIRSEIGGRRGCLWMAAAIILVDALAMGLSWWVIYG